MGEENGEDRPAGKRRSADAYGRSDAARNSHYCRLIEKFASRFSHSKRQYARIQALLSVQRAMRQRGRGRPRLLPETPEPAAPPALPPVGSAAALPRLAFDYSDLEAAMAAADQAISDTRHSLERIRQASRLD